MTALGAVLIAAAALLLLADTGQLSARLPTQVPPRTFALLPLAAGVLFLLLGVAYGS